MPFRVSRTIFRFFDDSPLKRYAVRTLQYFGITLLYCLETDIGTVIHIIPLDIPR